MRPRNTFQGRGLLAIAASALAIQYVAPEHVKPYDVENGVALVSIEGPLTQKAEFIWDSYESIRARAFAAFDDPEVRAVLLDVNSPGGDVAGCFELAAELRAKAMTSKKRFVAFTDGMAASAAYALATAAPEVFVTQTAQVGSIGVINALVDVTALDRAQGLKFSVISSGERKKDGNPHVAITDEAEETLRMAVNEMASIFFAWVNRTRGIDAAQIQNFDGALFLGTSAVKVGLANGVTTKSDLLATLARAPSASAAGQSETTTMADEDKENEDTKDAPKSYEDDMRARLEEDSKSDDEKKASAAKKMLAALDGEGGEKKDEKKDEPAKSEDEEDGKANASAHLASPVALVTDTTLAALTNSVAALHAKIDANDRSARKQKRADLIASHDLPPALAKSLATEKLETVERIVAPFPKRAARNLAAAEQSTVAVTVPRGSADPNAPRAPRMSADAKAKLDERMGLKAVTDGGITKDRNFVTLGIVPRKKDQKQAAVTPGKVA